MTNDQFATSLGVAPRTVASWHSRAEVILRADLQRVLDTAYERAPEGARVRFLRETQGHTAGQGRALTVAIAVVVKGSDVLLVCRRDAEIAGLAWQFPAGVVKPGGAPELAAVRETLAETGVHCAVRESLGNRLHPVTSVHCEYFLCDYLAGEVENRDPAENISAIWAPRNTLTRFVPSEKIFPPVLDALEKEPL